MKAGGKIAARYAKAIFDYLGEPSRREAVARELAQIGRLSVESRELGLLFSLAIFSDEKRRAIIDDLAGRLSLSEDTRRILRVLSRSRRLNEVQRIAERLHDLILKSEEIVAIRVESAFSLDSSAKSLIESRFGSMLNKKIEAIYVEDPSLIGGVRVTAGGKTYNGSIAGWLQNFEERLVGG